MQYTAERLKQSMGNHRGGRKKNAVTAVVSPNLKQAEAACVGTASQVNPELEFSGNPTVRKSRTAGFS